MSSITRKMKRQIQKNRGELECKKVLARKLGVSVSEYNARMKQREKNLREMEEKYNGK